MVGGMVASTGTGLLLVGLQVCLRRCRVDRRQRFRRRRFRDGRLRGGQFKREIAAVETKAGAVDTDELPRKAKPEKIPSLKPAFTDGGTVCGATY